MVGTVRAWPATYSLRVEWTLNHQVPRLQMRDVSDPPAYQATVYIGYDNTSERYGTVFPENASSGPLNITETPAYRRGMSRLINELSPNPPLGASRR